jgi:myo-inositol-hexaphosphate 3-phosphohydrolase
MRATLATALVALCAFFAAGTVTRSANVAGEEAPAVGAPASSTRTMTVSRPDVAPVEVSADAETLPVAHSGDAADDAAIWVDRRDPARSLVIGNDKQGALEVYGLDGTRVQRITTATTFWGNVDRRSGVTIGGTTRDLVVAYNAGIRTFAVDPATRHLESVGDGTGVIDTDAGEGLCAYRSAVSGDLFVFVVTRAGGVQQYLLHDADGDGLVQGTLVREFSMGSESEGCVADDGNGRLFVSEEDVGLWRLGAEPDAGSARVLVDAVRPQGSLSSDVEGVTLARTGPGAGYLIVSAQNVAQPSRSYFAVYDRHTEDYLWSFRIGSGASADGCERTDGVAVYAGDLGPAFPRGMFVCQDNDNTSPGVGNQDFKLTRLERVLP